MENIGDNKFVLSATDPKGSSSPTGDNNFSSDPGLGSELTPAPAFSLDDTKVFLNRDLTEDQKEGLKVFLNEFTSFINKSESMESAYLASLEAVAKSKYHCPSTNFMTMQFVQAVVIVYDSINDVKHGYDLTGITNTKEATAYLTNRYSGRELTAFVERINGEGGSPTSFCPSCFNNDDEKFNSSGNGVLTCAKCDTPHFSYVAMDHKETLGEYRLRLVKLSTNTQLDQFLIDSARSTLYVLVGYNKDMDCPMDKTNFQLYVKAKFKQALTTHLSDYSDTEEESEAFVDKVMGFFARSRDQFSDFNDENCRKLMESFSQTKDFIENVTDKVRISNEQNMQQLQQSLNDVSKAVETSIEGSNAALAFKCISVAKAADDFANYCREHPGEIAIKAVASVVGTGLIVGVAVGVWADIARSEQLESSPKGVLVGFLKFLTGVAGTLAGVQLIAGLADDSLMVWVGHLTRAM